MSEEKKKESGKKYSEEEHNKILTKTMEDFKNSMVSYDISQGWVCKTDGAGELRITVRGGDLNNLRILGLKLESEVTKFMESALVK